MHASHQAADTAYLGKREQMCEILETVEKRSEDEEVEKVSSNIKSHRIAVKKRLRDQPEEVKEIIKTYRVVDGIAPVDEHVTNRDRFRVCNLFNKTYSKILSQSDVTENTNKFYILQMLENIDSKDIFVYFRWGRQGAKGTECLIPFGRNTGAAIADLFSSSK